MKRINHELNHNHSRLNLKKTPKEEALEWSPTGYGLISAIHQNDTEEADSKNY